MCVESLCFWFYLQLSFTATTCMDDCRFEDLIYLLQSFKRSFSDEWNKFSISSFMFYVV